MKTSEQWWSETKSDPNKLVNWLKDQYHGERTAAARIQEHIYNKLDQPADRAEVQLIIFDEMRHAGWVASLLKARNIKPEVLNKQERYWESVKDANPLAIAAHAEAMRLERIKVIAADQDAPEDIRSVFENILVDEQRHAEVFSRLAGADLLDQTAQDHAKGLEAIGLII